MAPFWNKKPSLILTIFFFSFFASLTSSQILISEPLQIIHTHHNICNQKNKCQKAGKWVSTMTVILYYLIVSTDFHSNCPQNLDDILRHRSLQFSSWNRADKWSNFLTLIKNVIQIFQFCACTIMITTNSYQFHVHLC